jgi:DnaJ like chaperone protein
MFLGKFVAAAIGAMTLGVPGALIGLLVGHWFDRGIGATFSFASPERIAAMQAAFFEASFLLLGRVAKADGRVSEAEVAHTEEIMRQFGLSEDRRQTAIGLFKRGTAPDFDMPAAVARFNEACHNQRQLQQTLLIFLISLALADGHFDGAEHDTLGQIASAMGFTAADFARLLEMVEAQGHFHRSGQSPAAAADQLGDAYRALGVAPDCDQRTLKQAYRKLMSQNHPDKLIAKGVPEDMIKLGTERSQEIQAAYEMIKKARR